MKRGALAEGNVFSRTGQGKVRTEDLPWGESYSAPGCASTESVLSGSHGVGFYLKLGRVM